MKRRRDEGIEILISLEEESVDFYIKVWACDKDLYDEKDTPTSLYVFSPALKNGSMKLKECNITPTGLDKDREEKLKMCFLMASFLSGRQASINDDETFILKSIFYSLKIIRILINFVFTIYSKCNR